MARPWVMLHTKALDSYTLSQLSDKAYRGFMEVLMLAGRVDDDGYIGEREEIAFALRRSNDEMSEIFNELQPKGLIDYSDRGWFIENWDEHQPKTTSTERVRKSRAKKAQSKKNEGANSESVTRNVTEASQKRDSNAIEKNRIDKNIKDNKDIVSLSDTKKTETHQIFLSFRDIWKIHFPNKPQPRINNRSLIKKFNSRLKDPEFRERWQEALSIGQSSSFLQAEGWFTAGWFLKNDENWLKVLDGNYSDSKPPAPQRTVTEIVLAPDGSY